jgi:hypothetical protein
MDPRPALVARDRGEPGVFLARWGTTQDGAMRREEDLLSCVLGLDRIAKQQTTQAEHHSAVIGEQLRDEGAGRSLVGAAGRG